MAKLRRFQDFHKISTHNCFKISTIMYVHTYTHSSAGVLVHTHRLLKIQKYSWKIGNIKHKSFFSYFQTFKKYKTRDSSFIGTLHLHFLWKPKKNRQNWTLNVDSCAPLILNKIGRTYITSLWCHLRSTCENPRKNQSGCAELIKEWVCRLWRRYQFSF